MIEPRGCVELGLPLSLQLRRPPHRHPVRRLHAGGLRRRGRARRGPAAGRLRRREDDRRGRCRTASSRSSGPTRATAEPTTASTGASSTAPTAARRACAPSTCATSELAVSDFDTIPCTDSAIPEGGSEARQMSETAAVAEAEELVAEAAAAAAAAPRARVHARAEPGPEGHPRLGPRLRRGRRPPRRRRVGRARGDALAGDPGGRQDRPLRLRRPGPVLGRPDRPDAADRQRGAVLGRRRHRHVRSWAPRWRSPRSSGRGPRSRWASGSRSASAPPDDAEGRRLLLLGAGRRLRRLGDPHHRQVRRGEGRVGPQRPEGVGDQRRHRRRPRRHRHASTASSARAATPPSSSRRAPRAASRARR